MPITDAPTIPTTTPAARSEHAVDRLPRPQLVAATVAVAVAVNLAIWAVGALAGGSFEFTDGEATQRAAPGGVVLMTAVPLTLGLTLSALASLWSARLVRVAQVVGSLAALLTIGGTLATDFDAVSTVTLSLTHVAIVPPMLVALEAMRRRAQDEGR